MDFQDAVKSQYYQPTIQDLSGEIMASRYPTLVSKCQYFHDGVMTVRGQQFNGCHFKNIIVTGGGVFIDCFFGGCEFHSLADGESVLSFYGGTINSSTFKGFYNRFDFMPNYTKEVTFINGFETLDLSVKFNCASWGGVHLDDKPAAMLASFVYRALERNPTAEEIDLGRRRINNLLAEFTESL